MNRRGEADPKLVRKFKRNSIRFSQSQFTVQLVEVIINYRNFSASADDILRKVISLTSKEECYDIKFPRVLGTRVCDKILNGTLWMLLDSQDLIKILRKELFIAESEDRYDLEDKKILTGLKSFLKTNPDEKYFTEMTYHFIKTYRERGD